MEKYYTSCDLQWYINFANEVYDISNYPMWLTLYGLFQTLGIFGILFSAFESWGDALKFYYLGFRQMFAAAGIE